MPSTTWTVLVIVGGVVVVVAIFVLRPILKSITVRGAGGEMKIDTHDRPLGRPGDATMEGVKGRSVRNVTETGGAASMRNIEAKEDVENLSTNRPAGASGDSAHPKP